MKEKWKVVEGFSKYLISNTGRVKNIVELTMYIKICYTCFNKKFGG